MKATFTGKEYAYNCGCSFVAMLPFEGFSSIPDFCPVHNASVETITELYRIIGMEEVQVRKGSGE